MATVVRPPFWVPRPSDPPEWNGNRIIDWQNSGAIQLTTSQAKFFGQSGQAPTKRWMPPVLDTWDDPPPWQPNVANLDSWILSELTQQKVFRAGGQVPPFRPNFIFDDPPSWQPPVANLDSWILSELTQQRMFGAGGQVKPWIIHWNWLIDDATTYDGRSSPKHLLVAVILTSQLHTRFDPVLRNDDTAPWSPGLESLNMPAPLFQQSQGAPFKVTARWNSYDETAPWSPLITNLDSSAIQLTITQAKFYGQNGQGYPFRWNATLDDPPVYTWSSVGLNRDLLASINPFSNLRPSYWTQNDPPSWSPTAPQSQPIVLTTTQAKFYGQAGQGYPFRPNFTQDDSAFWVWVAPAWNKNALTQITAPLTHSLPTFYQDDAWVGSPRGLNLNTGPAVSPFLHTPSTFYSEDAFWVGRPTPMRTIFTQARFYGQPGQSPPFRPNFTQDDPAVYQWPPQDSQPIRLTTTQQRLYGLPGEVTPRFWAFNYDDASAWRSTPLPALNLYIVIKPPLPPANVVYSLSKVTVTLSNSIVGCVTSISVAADTDSGSSSSAISSISRVGDAGSSSEVS